MRPTYAEIDLGAIRHNVAALAALVAPASLCTVVKADAYGHGDAPVAQSALESGAAMLAVALVEEGARLREAGIEAPILLLSEPAVQDAADVLGWDLTPTVYSRKFLEELSRLAEAPIDVHLKVDTGMHRVGAAPEDFADLADAVRPPLRLAGVWTHFAVADEDAEFTAHQMRTFAASVPNDVDSTHMSNTAGALLFPEARADLVRIGLGTYGLHPCPETTAVVDLVPAMRLVSAVSHVQSLSAGERLSYGRRRPLPADSSVATVPIGYADGVPRRLSSVGGEVLIGGKRRPLAGTVTMDQLMVDMGGDPVQDGDEVVLLGSQGREAIGADDWAEKLDTISYEIVCGIGPRVPRRYIEGR